MVCVWVIGSVMRENMIRHATKDKPTRVLISTLQGDHLNVVRVKGPAYMRLCKTHIELGCLTMYCQSICHLSC